MPTSADPQKDQNLSLDGGNSASQRLKSSSFRVCVTLRHFGVTSGRTVFRSLNNCFGVSELLSCYFQDLSRLAFRLDYTLARKDYMHKLLFSN